MEHAPGRGLQPHLTACVKCPAGDGLLRGRRKNERSLSWKTGLPSLIPVPVKIRKTLPDVTEHTAVLQTSHMDACGRYQPGSEPGESAALMHSRKPARPCPSLPVPDISCFRCPERICQGPGQPAMHKSCQSLLRLPFCCLMSEGAGQGKNDPGIQPMVKKSTAQYTDCRFFPEIR